MRMVNSIGAVMIKQDEIDHAIADEDGVLLPQYEQTLKIENKAA